MPYNKSKQWVANNTKPFVGVVYLHARKPKLLLNRSTNKISGGKYRVKITEFIPFTGPVSRVIAEPQI
jgi:hypothetical protein